MIFLQLTSNESTIFLITLAFSVAAAVAVSLSLGLAIGFLACALPLSRGCSNNNNKNKKNDGWQSEVKEGSDLLQFLRPRYDESEVARLTRRMDSIEAGQSSLAANHYSPLVDNEVEEEMLTTATTPPPTTAATLVPLPSIADSNTTTTNTTTTNTITTTNTARTTNTETETRRLTNSRLQPAQSDTETFDNNTPPPRFVQGLQVEGEGEPLRRWRETRNWRINNNIDNILDEPQREFATIKRHYKHFYGPAKGGKVVYYQQLGSSNLTALCAIDTPTLVRHFVFLTEFCFRVLAPTQQAKVITIYDLANFGISDITSDATDMFKQVAKLYQEHYVGRSEKPICILNSGWAFRALWAMAKPLLAERTRNKVAVLGSDYKETLTELIGGENLPEVYGGTNTSWQFEDLIKQHVNTVLERGNG